MASAKQTTIQPLNIVYIIGSYPGLTTTFIDREITILRRWGVNIQVLAIRRPAANTPLSTEQRQLQQGVVYLLPVQWLKFMMGHLYFVLTRPWRYFTTLFYLLTRPHPGWRAWLMTLVHFQEGVYAAQLLRHPSCNQLHAHFADRAALVALVVSRLLNIPYSLTAHANDIYVNPVLLRQKITGAAFIITCTAYNLNHLQQLMGAAVSDKLHLAYHGLNLSNYQPAIPAHRAAFPFILAIGRLTEKKGFTHLITACQQLHRQEHHFKCAIIGEGPLRQPLQAQIDAAGLNQVITLAGAMPHEAVIEQYHQATLFVLPSLTAKDGDRDGLPNVLIEAMALQLPVISTCQSAIPELVQDQVNGLLVPPGDATALAQALTTLLTHPDLADRLGQRGRQTVLENFDVEYNVRHLFELFTR